MFNRAKERASLLKAKADSELARIVDTASTPIFSLDRNASILMWNKRLQDLSGYKTSEALGMNFLKNFVHPDHVDKIQGVLTSAFEKGEGSVNFELKLQLRNGETRVLLVSSSVRRCLSDEVSSVVFVSSDDITALQEQRRSELKVHAEVEYTNFLAHEVRNPLTGRSPSLFLNPSFIEPLFLNILCATVGIDCSSHNLAVDLNNIDAFATSIAYTIPNNATRFQPLFLSLDECEVESKHIRSCVGYILKILDNTLDVSRITLEKTAVLLRVDVITPSLFMLQSLVSKELSVKCNCDENIFVFADVLRLQQVIMNVLTNAFKFAKEGTVDVMVSIDANTHLVKIEIRDEGPGVAEENREMLFSKYGQIEVRQGTGLGLSLSYQLVSAMGGRIYLDSSYSRGASFVVELPGGRRECSRLLDRRMSRTGSLYLQGTVEAVFAADYVPLNLAVLLVDDSKAATRLLRRRLEMCADRAKSWDCWAVAQTAEQALELCRQNGGAYDVVVMDQNMQAAGGVLLGHEAIHIMRQELHMARTVIVGCSGNADTCEALFLEAGADGMWSKPTPPTVNMIRDLCRYRAARLSPSPLVVGLPGMVQILILHDNNHLFPDLTTHVPPSWGFHRSSGGHDQIKSLASICQVAIIVDSFASSASCRDETTRILRESPSFQNDKEGVIILCVEDSEYEEAIKNIDVNLILRKNDFSADEILRAFSLLLTTCP